jgi:hypothetical protein
MSERSGESARDLVGVPNPKERSASWSHGERVNIVSRHRKASSRRVVESVGFLGMGAAGVAAASAGVMVALSAPGDSTVSANTRVELASTDVPLTPVGQTDPFSGPCGFICNGAAGTAAGLQDRFIGPQRRYIATL